MARPARETAAIERLPAPERTALFERTLKNLTTVCAGPEAHALANFCHSQASLLVKFPECDASCRALAQPLLPEPTR